MRTNSLEESLEQVVQRLIEGLQPEQIILFGSYAYGQPTEGSELDIMVIVSCKKRTGAWEPTRRGSERFVSIDA